MKGIGCFTILGLLAIALLTSCGSGDKKPGAGPVKTGDPGKGAPAGPVEVTVGCNLELTGDVGSWGQDSRKGLDLAAEELNADTKAGVKITLKYEDNNSDVAKSKDAIKKLILQENAHVVIGCVGSNYTMAAMDVARDERVPMVTHASTNVTITQKGGEYIFRICFHDDFQGEVMAKFALAELKAKTAVLLVQKGNAYSEGLIASYKKAFTAGGGQVLAEEAYQRGDTDYQTMITKVKSANPDVVWLPGYFNEVALIIKQARAAGFQKAFLGGDGWDDPKLYDLGGPSIKDNYLCNHFDSGDTAPKVKEFVEKYKKKYNNAVPGAMAALGYDALYCVADAVRRAGKADPKAIRDALATLKNVETVCGTVTMGADREVTKPAVVLRTGEKAHEFHKRQ